MTKIGYFKAGDKLFYDTTKSEIANREKINIDEIKEYKSVSQAIHANGKTKVLEARENSNVRDRLRKEAGKEPVVKKQPTPKVVKPIVKKSEKPTVKKSEKPVVKKIAKPVVKKSEK